MQKILLILHRCARFLRPIKLPLITFTLLALLLTSYCLVADSGLALDLLEPAIVASLWGMLILANIELFQTRPEGPGKPANFWHRVIIRGRLFLYSLLAVVTLMVFVSLIWLSLRLLLI